MDSPSGGVLEEVSVPIAEVGEMASPTRFNVCLTNFTVAGVPRSDQSLSKYEKDW